MGMTYVRYVYVIDSRISELKTTYGQLPRWDWLECHAEGQSNRIGCGKRLSIIVYKKLSG